MMTSFQIITVHTEHNCIPDAFPKHWVKSKIHADPFWWLHLHVSRRLWGHRLSDGGQSWPLLSLSLWEWRQLYCECLYTKYITVLLLMEATVLWMLVKYSTILWLKYTGGLCYWNLGLDKHCARRRREKESLGRGMKYIWIILVYREHMYWWT